MIKRALKLSEYLGEMNLLFLGPRQTGKSTLLVHELKEKAFFINLLESET